MKNVFNELSESELCETNGGFLLTSTLFTVAGIKITGVMCVEAGLAVGMTAATLIRKKNN